MKSITSLCFLCVTIFCGILAAVSSVDLHSASPASAAQPAEVQVAGACYRIRLRTLTPAVVEEIRREPGRIVAVFQRCRGEMANELGPNFAHLRERELQYVFCAVLAHALAPVGPSHAVEFAELLQARTLNCGNYGLLAAYLARSFGSEPVEEPRLCFVGWEGGVIGNHQVLFLQSRSGDRSLLLDPTIGLVADTNFDAVASGKPLERNRIVLFRVREELEDFKACEVEGLAGGRFKPSDLLYYFDSLEQLTEHYGEPETWPTPGASTWRGLYPRSIPVQTAASS